MILPTQKALQEIWGGEIEWGLKHQRGHLFLNSYTPEQGFCNGDLGNDSAPNPLVEGIMGIFHFTYFATQEFFTRKL